MVRVVEKVNRVDGAVRPVNAAGFMIHSAIHKRRPDINAACHMHSPYGRAWKTFGKGIDMLNQGIILHCLNPRRNYCKLLQALATKVNKQIPACSMMTSRSILPLGAWSMPTKKVKEL